MVSWKVGESSSIKTLGMRIYVLQNDNDSVSLNLPHILHEMAADSSSGPKQPIQDTPTLSPWGSLIGLHFLLKTKHE